MKSGQVCHDSSFVSIFKENLSSSPSYCKIYTVDSLSGIETSLRLGKNFSETSKGSIVETSSLPLIDSLSFGLSGPYNL